MAPVLDTPLILRSVLSDLGYDAALVVATPVVRSLAPSVGAMIVAFVDQVVRDVSTTAIVCTTTDELDASIRTASQLSAPSVLTTDGLTIQLRSAEGHLILEWPVDSPTPPAVRRELSPQAILAAKLGLRQLTLFPQAADQLRKVRSLGTSVVARVVTEALALAAQASPDLLPNLRAQSQAVVTAMTVAAFRDKIHRNVGITDAFLTETVIPSLPSTLSWLHDNLGARRFVCDLSNYLAESVDFSPLDQTILGHVYEETVASKLDRGTFYTPPSVAEALVDLVPFEFLPPDRRTVLDPACGSGSLLYAARKRLALLQPRSWSPDIRHQDLVSRLWGGDRDPFAVGLAQLGLVLTDLAAGNGWRISTKDIGEYPLSTIPQGIVLMNPPWRSAVARKLDDGEVADRFVNWMLDRVQPNSAFGLILPTSWLTKNQSSSTRQRLLKAADVTDIARLPDRLFQSRTYPCLVVGVIPGRPAPRSMYVQHHVWRSGRKTFQSDGLITESAMVPTSTDRLSGGPVSSWFDAQGFESLGRLISSLRIGSQPIKGLGSTSTSSSAKGIAFLHTTRGLRSWSEVNEAGLVFRRGEDFEHLDETPTAADPKLLVGAFSDPSSPRRLKVIFNRVGAHFINSCWGIVPKPALDLDTLGAILASDLMSAYVDDLCPGINLRMETIEQMPLPRPEQLQRLERQVRDILVSHPARDRESAAPSAEMLQAVEVAVRQAYGVPPALSELIEARFEERPFNAGLVEPAHTERLLGIVEEFDNSLVSIASNSPDWPDGRVKVPLPVGFKGSMLWGGCGFTIERPIGVQPNDAWVSSRFTHDPRIFELLSGPTTAE